jgi:tetratricopeptide (TPR) repeat protein
MEDHPRRARVAELLVQRGKESSRGSGYLIADGWVLTARHVIAGADVIRLWLGAPSKLRSEDELRIEPPDIVALLHADLALLPLPESAHAEVSPVLWGHLDRDSTRPVPAAASGFPLFKLREPPGGGAQVRDAETAYGELQGGSNLKTGSLPLHMLSTVPDMPGLSPERSPWEGMSGAAVWSSNRLVGVIAKHHREEGAATLTAVPVDGVFADPSDVALWRSALPGFPPEREQLWSVTPRSERELVAVAAQRDARSLAPAVLIARDSQLERLDRFARSTEQEERWRWLTASAFAGKTALLAYFALHPPDGVKVAACFLRHTKGLNGPGYVLPTLTRQLAAIAGEDAPESTARSSPDSVGSVPGFHEILGKAATACRQQDRRLLVLIDGLDEYHTAFAGLDVGDWMPDADTLPETACLLVSSRHGVPVDLPSNHPLRSGTEPLEPSETGAGIAAQALEAIEQIVKDDRSTLKILGCLAAAETGLSPVEVATLIHRRRGEEPSDVDEIAHQLEHGFGNALIRAGDSGANGDVYSFAHEALLTAARRLVSRETLTGYARALDEWADDYAERGWPESTPRFLLLAYTDLLVRRLDEAADDARRHVIADRLWRTASGAGRSYRLASNTGNPALAEREVATVYEVLVQARSDIGIDGDELLYRLAVLALRRRPLRGSSADVASSVAIAWATCGDFEPAIALAAGIQERYERERAAGKIANALAHADRPTEAIDAMHRIGGADARRRVLSQPVVEAFLRAIDLDGARALAGDIENTVERLFALVPVASAYAYAGRRDEAVEIASEGAAAALGLQHEDMAVELIGRLACAVAGVAPADARRLTLQLRQPRQRALALALLAARPMEDGVSEQGSEVISECLAVAHSIGEDYVRARTLANVARIVGAAAGRASAESAARDAVAVAVNIAEASQRAQTLANVAMELVDAGHVELGREAASSALKDAGQIGDASERSVVLRRLVSVLSHTGNRELAATACAAAIAAAEHVGDVGERAGRLFEIVRDLAGEDGIGGASLLEAARSIHRSARTVADPNTRSELLSKAHSALRRAGEPEEAAAALDAAFAAAYETRHHFGGAHAGYYLVGAITALDPPADALAAANRAPDPAWRDKAIQDIVQGMARAGAVSDARAAADRIVDRGVRGEALAGISVILAAAGDHDGARESGRRAVEVAHSQDDPDRVSLFASAAERLASGGFHAAGVTVATLAREGLASAPEDFLFGDRHVAAVARALASVGMSADAMSVIEGRALRDTAHPLGEIAVVYARANDHRNAGSAIELWSRAVLDLDNTHGLRERTVECLAEELVKHASRAALARLLRRTHRWLRPRFACELASSLAQRGELDGATKIAAKIRPRSWRALALARVSARCDDVRRARSTAQKAIAAAAKVRDAGQRDITLNLVLDDVLTAVELLDGARVARSIADDARRATALWSVCANAGTAAGDALVGVAGDALSAAAAVEVGDKRDESLAAAAGALAFAGDAERAGSALGNIAAPGWRAICWARLAWAAAAGGEIAAATARAAFAIAERDATDRDDWFTHAFAFDEALSLAAVRLAGLDAIADAIDIAVEIDDAYWTAGALRVLARAMVHLGEADRALAITKRLQAEDDLRGRVNGPIVLETVARALADDGATDRAIEVAREIEDGDRRMTALTAVADDIRGRGDLTSALTALDVAAAAADQRGDPSQVDALREIARRSDKVAASAEGDHHGKASEVGLLARCILLRNPPLAEAVPVLPAGVLDRLVSDGVLA